MKRLLLIAVLILAFAGCQKYQPKADPGGAGWERMEETRQDGVKVVQERATFTAPQDDSKGSNYSFRIPVDPGSPWESSGSFGGQYAPPEPESAGAVWGQRALYASGIVLFLLAGGLIAYGRHFRLAKIAAALGALLIGGAVVIDKYPMVIVLGVCIVAVIGGAWLGWMLWTDYKESQE